MYQYINAGCTFPTYAGVNLFVKFTKRKGKYREEHYPGYKVFHLLDRKLLFITNGNKIYNNIHIKEKYDYCVDADYMGFDSCIRHTGLMFIYEKQESQRLHRVDKSKFKNKKLFVDSGGFKLATGTEKFIDPEDLARYYNLYANQGMALDVATGKMSDKNMLLRIAKIQKLNTDIIYPLLNRDVTLYNISHGITDDFRKKYIDTVYDDRLDHWAVGSAKGGDLVVNPFDFLSRIFLNIDMVGLKKIKSIHLLGIADTMITPILAWLGKYCDLTSDSAAAVKKSAGNGMTELWGKSLKTQKVGSSHSYKYILSNYTQKLSCNCPICTAIDSNELFIHSPTAIGTMLLCLHNTNLMSDYTRYWVELANTLSLEDFKREYSEMLVQGNRATARKELRKWLLALDYIEDFIARGFKSSLKEYKMYRTNNVFLDSKKGCPSQMNLFSSSEEEDLLKNQRKEFRIKAIERYEKYHKSKSKG